MVCHSPNLSTNSSHRSAGAESRHRHPPAIAGRRSGKSRLAALQAVYTAVFERHHLSSGETGFILCLSPTRQQAQLIFRYALGFLQSAPLLERKIESVTADEIRLFGNITISVLPNSFKSVRGRTILSAIFDEAAYWTDETSANPALEVARACAPSLAASHGRLVGIGSPYRRSGLLFEKHKSHFGRDDSDVLVIQAPSHVLNPTLDEGLIARAMRDDPEAANSEWLAEFRSDISNFLDDQLIETAIDNDRPLELEPKPYFRYRGFVDASGGRSDAYALCIGHRENDNRFVVDCIRSRQPPFNPHETTAELAWLAKGYGLSMVGGDNYSAEWTQQAWRDQGLGYEKSDMPASRLFEEMLPSFTREQVKIPNHPALIKELRSLLAVRVVTR